MNKHKPFPLDHYKYFSNPLTGTIYAVTRYAGKVVRAKAKCHIDDIPDATIGRTLAGMRCGCKVNERRLRFAKARVQQAKDEFLRAERNYHKQLQIFAEIEETHYNDKQALKDYLRTLNTPKS